jgi:hypothetical protein
MKNSPERECLDRVSHAGEAADNSITVTVTLVQKMNIL